MHKRNIIREYFKKYLKTLVPLVQDRVFAGRIDPNLTVVNYPYLVITTGNESVIDTFTGYTERELSLKVGVVVSENQLSIDDDFSSVIDTVCLQVEQAMTLYFRVPVSGLYKPLNYNEPLALFEKLELNNTTENMSNESSSDIGISLLDYTVTYYYENPIRPFELLDFDLDGSIGHIQILNKGVPIDD